MKKILYCGIIGIFWLLLPFNVEAAVRYTEGYFAYSDQGSYASITEYFGNEELVIIPAVLGGKPVAKIEKNAFSEALAVHKIEIPDTVIDLDDDALKSKGNLEEVSFYSVSNEQNLEEHNIKDQNKDSRTNGVNNDLNQKVGDNPMDFTINSDELTDVPNATIEGQNDKKISAQQSDNFSVDEQVFDENNNSVDRESFDAKKINMDAVVVCLVLCAILIVVVLYFRKRGNSNEIKRRNHS